MFLAWTTAQQMKSSPSMRPGTQEEEMLAWACVSDEFDTVGRIHGCIVRMTKVK